VEHSDVVQPFHRLVGIAGTVVGQFDLIGAAIGRLMEGKPIDGYIKAITLNIAEMLGLDLTQFEFQTIVDQISTGIDTALGYIENFKTGWGLLTEKIGEFKGIIDSEWFQAHITEPLTRLRDLLGTELPEVWANTISEMEEVQRQFDSVGKATGNWERVLNAVERVIRSLTEAWGMMGSVFGGTNEKLAENNKQMGRSRTLGDELAIIFGTLADTLNGYAAAVQWVTEKLRALIALAIGAQSALDGAMGAINQGASAAAGNATGQGLPVTEETGPKGDGSVPKPSQAVGDNRVSAPATGMLAPAATNTTRTSNVTINVTVQGGGTGTYQQARDGVLDGLRSAGIR